MDTIDKLKEKQTEHNKRIKSLYEEPFKIIKDSFEILKGKWGVTIMTFLSAFLLNIVVLVISAFVPWLIGYTLSFVLGNDFVWGVRTPSIFFYFLFLINIFIANLLMGRVFLWQNKFMLDTVRGNSPDLNFNLLLEGLRSKDEIMQTIFTKKGFIQFTAPGLILAVLSAVISLGYVAIIVPGILFSLWFAFVPFLITDDPKLNLSESFQLSKDQTRGYRLSIFFFMVVLGSIQAIFIMLTFGFGFILAAPFGMVAMAKFYDNHLKRN